MVVLMTISCNSNRQSESNVARNDDNRYVLEKIISDKHNGLLASLDDNCLDLCCYENLNLKPEIDFKKFEQTEEQYEIEGKIEKVNVYKFMNSIIKTHFNKHPQVMKLNIVCGRISNQEISFNKKIKLGMSKNEFLELNFKPSNLFYEIDSVVVAEDEMGEAEITFRFENEKLIEIKFDSEYDWINKNLDLKN